MMIYNFRDHDRVVEASSEWRSLSTAQSRLTRAGQEDRQARRNLLQAKASPPHQMDGDHALRLHQEQIEKLHKEADRCAHELDAAKAEVDRLKRACVRQQLEGRVETHRQITARIIGAARMLQDAIADDQQFREQLVRDLLSLSSPLQSLGPWAWEGGGPGWIDGLLPLIKEWLAKMEKSDPYDLSKKPATSPKRAAPQPVRV